MEILRCQQCQTPLNLNDETLDRDASCPTCGSKAPLGERATSQRQSTKTAIGRFELLEEVGRGQFGAVWRARDTLLRRIVALKIPRRESLDLHTRKMFLREAAAAAALSHPGIVSVYEIVEDAEQIYIVSEFINGDDLKLWLAGEGFASLDDAARFMMSAAEAIHHAHERGIIHRDLKPGNILVGAGRRPHITDFGLAKIESHETTMTVYGDQPVGTLSYMSPEQAAGNVHDLDRRSDVFSLGAIFYEILVRERPFVGVGLDILEKVRHAEPARPSKIRPDLPRGLETICLKALAKDPTRRYATAQELADDLRRFLAGQPTLARPVTPVETAIRWVRKNFSFATACTIALLSTAAAAFALFQSQSSNLPVELATFPPGARVVLFPLDPMTNEPRDGQAIRPTARTPFSIRIPPADYLVVAQLDDGRFHEVYRRVPQDPHSAPDLYPHRKWQLDERGILQLPTINIPALDVNNGMTRFAGGEQFGVHEGRTETRARIAPFQIETHEVTVDEFREIILGDLEGFGVPGISGQCPMTRLPYDFAAWYAEEVGKRLPTESEFEFAMTNGGTTKFPWGNDGRPVSLTLVPVGTVDFDKTATDPPVHGLLSNGEEFTATPYLMDHRAIGSRSSSTVLSMGAFDAITVRGFAGTESGAGIERQFSIMRRGLRDSVGFRCVRSQFPRR